MRKILSLLFIFIAIKCYSQNKQVLYNFAELPQTLLLNPGAETNYKFHVGVPLLSGFSSEVGLTGSVVSDLFLADNIAINDKFLSALEKIDNRDYVKFNSQIEILTAGFKYKDKTYFSFGLYQEVDAIAYYPKDFITLITDGNAAYLNKRFGFSEILYKIDVLGVLHFGASTKVSEKLTLGARFKLYSSALNTQSSNNYGSFTTVNGTNNIYTHYLDNVNVSVESSGLIGKDDEFIENPKTYLNNIFLSSNFGVGVDIGMTYHFSDQLEFTGSIVDFGFIRHRKNTKNYTASGDYVFEGIAFRYDPTNPSDYWQELKTDFEENIVLGENNNAYTSWRPTKVNASLRYSFGRKRSKYCYENTYKDFYTNAFGVQLYSVFRPLTPQFALTGFYEKSLSNKLHAKVTYTIDDYSFYNIGAGISAQLGKINLYGMVDNIAQFRDIASANNMSVQLGINVIFN